MRVTRSKSTRRGALGLYQLNVAELDEEKLDKLAIYGAGFSRIRSDDQGGAVYRPAMALEDFHLETDEVYIYNTLT